MGYMSALPEGSAELQQVFFVHSHAFMKKNRKSIGLMDQASASRAGDSRIESWVDQRSKFVS